MFLSHFSLKTIKVTILKRYAYVQKLFLSKRYNLQHSPKNVVHSIGNLLIDLFLKPNTHRYTTNKARWHTLGIEFSVRVCFFFLPQEQCPDVCNKTRIQKHPVCVRFSYFDNLLWQLLRTVELYTNKIHRLQHDITSDRTINLSKLY